MAVVFDVFEFYNLITTKQQNNSSVCGKILGIDYGTRKLGIAVGDGTTGIAFPKDVIINNWRNSELLQTEIIKQAVKYNTKNIVMGLPKKNDNTLDDKCGFITEVANKLCETDKMLQVLLFDERFTTKQALAMRTQSVISSRHAKNSKKEKHNAVYDDAYAASIILQNVLDLISSYNLDNNY